MTTLLVLCVLIHECAEAPSIHPRDVSKQGGLSPEENSMWKTTLRLFARFAQLGGMAGTAIFLSQGEFLKAVQCTTVAGICIVLTAVAVKVAGSGGGKPPD